MKRFTERFEKHGIWWRKYTVLHELIREFVRGTFLEISLRATARGFESHRLRQRLAIVIHGKPFFLQAEVVSSCWNIAPMLSVLLARSSFRRELGLDGSIIIPDGVITKQLAINCSVDR